MIKRIISKLPIIILATGGILRIATINAAALWYDEAATLYRTTIPFWRLATDQADQSGCVLLDLILHGLMKLSPHSLILLRLPSLVAGLVSLWLVWMLMRRFSFTLEQQIVTASLVAFLPGLIWIGQDARTYGLEACMFMVALWYLVNAKWLGFTAACGLLLYCHNTAVVLVAGLFILFLIHVVFVETELDWIHFRFEVKKFPIMFGILLLATIPVLVRILLRNELSIGPLQPWAPLLTGNWFLSSTMFAVWVHLVANDTLAVLIFCMMAFTLPLMVRKNGNSLMLMSWFIPLTLIVIISLAWNNILLYRTIMPLLYAFSIWLGWTLMQRPVMLMKFILAGMWMVMLGISLVTWSPAQRGGNLDYVAASIRSEFQPGDVLVYTTYTVSMPMDYYLNDLPHVSVNLASAPFLNIPNGSFVTDNAQLDGAKRIWFITPEDILLTDEEEAEITAIRGAWSKPVYQAKYPQAATIDVWLVDGQAFR
jgi:hypothetical protein